tara:strand:- start:931 stop:1722 length:792 start_codon:yes stop_codon:yes gene_type:complete
MLLSKPESNFKISKNLKENYNTYSLNFAHSDISGFNVCAMANRLSKNENNSKKSNCSSDCVGYNGNAQIYRAVMESRIKKTLSYFLDKQSFLNQLVYEVEKAIIQSNKKGLKPSFRLNAYSDIQFEKDIIKDNKNIFQLFPDVKFYDYSKLINRKTPKNYQLTYSHHNPDFKDTIIALNKGLNVAIVFEKLPKQIKINNKIYSVLDGDKTDLRIDETDKQGNNCIIGLKFKKGNKKSVTYQDALKKAVQEGFCLSVNNQSLIY